MSDLRALLEGLLDVWVEMLTPRLILPEEVRNGLLGIVLIGICVFWIGVFIRVAEQFREPVLIWFGVGFVLILVTTFSTTGASMGLVVRAAAFFACTLRFVGGFALAIFLRAKPLLGIGFLFLMGLSAVVGFFAPPSLREVELLVFTVILTLLAGVGVFNILSRVSRVSPIYDHPAVIWGTTFMVSAVSLLDLRSLVPFARGATIWIPVVFVLRYSFGIGLALGAVTGVYHALRDRY